jgi:uncharacterized protein
MVTIVYDVLTLAAGAALLAAIHRRGLHPAWLAALLAADLLLALLLGRGMFDVMRLASHAIFVHAPLLAAGAAFLVRRTRRRTAIALAVAAAFVTAVGVDAFAIEPRWLEISRVTLTTDKLRRPIRIAVVSDIQMDHFDDHERAALAAVMRERPDLILMPGDYIQARSAAEHRAVREAFAAYLREIHFDAPLGVYAVQGNVEDPHRWTDIFAGLPITTFPTTGTITRDDIAITGLTLDDSFDRTLWIPPSDHFHVVLGHGPDFSLGHIDADLLVAGHTHGGQVRLPFVGPLVTLSAVPRAWAAGVTALPKGRTLVVSRGVGMERGPAPRLRFLCRPEIVIVEVTPRS